MTMRKSTFLATAAAAALALTLALTTTVQAQDVKQYGTEDPTKEELNKMLFPEVGKTGLGKTRGISRGLVFTGRQSDAKQPEANAEPDAPKPFGLAIEFDFDSAEILPASASRLDQIGEVLRSNRAIEFSIAIVGHTDAKGEDTYNQSLSERRAQAVRDYFVSRHGVDPGSLRVEGRGESELIDGADPNDAANRRVEFHRMQ